MGWITRTGVRATAVDFAYPYFVSPVGLISRCFVLTPHCNRYNLCLFRKPTPLPKYTAILWPFSSEVWISVGVSLGAFVFIYWAFSLLGPVGYGIDFGFGDSCSQAIMVLLSKGTYISGSSDIQCVQKV